MKTNKTKPIKKLLIFTIITVMIVSLFAVPAFADVIWPSVSGNVTPIDFTYRGANGPTSGATDYSVNTDGYYLITFTVADLRSAINIVGSRFGDVQQEPIVTFRPFNGANSTVSYTQVYTSTADEYFYANKIAGPNDDYYLTISINVGSGVQTMTVPHGISTRSYELTSNITAPMAVSFIVTEYPPTITADTATPTELFWNNLNYTVQKYTNETVPPTDPDDPTPPVDGEEQGIFAVWSQITQWIVAGLASVSNAFYANGELTLLGTLCIIPLALGLAFLLIAIIQKFLRLRG